MQQSCSQQEEWQTEGNSEKMVEASGVERERVMEAAEQSLGWASTAHVGGGPQDPTYPADRSWAVCASSDHASSG
ncbi:hypothetical protein HDU67_002052, partial [Dinochytrium kinnereticum]